MIFILLSQITSSITIGATWKFNTQRVSDNSSLIIHDFTGTNLIHIMIQNSSQYNSLQNYLNFYCVSNETWVPLLEYVSIHEVTNKEFPVFIPIEKKGKYYFSIYSCGVPIQAKTITFWFSNSWGYLIFEKYPCLYITWIEVGFYSILLIIVIVNSCRHCNFIVLLNWIIIISIAIQMICDTVSAVLYTVSNKNEELRGLNIAAQVMSCIRIFILILLSMFLASGLSIVYERLSWKKCLLIFISSAIFAVLAFFTENVTNTSSNLVFEVMVMIVYGVIFLIYGCILYYLTNEAIQTLSSHLVMIASVHIEPTTTPSYRKRELLYINRNCSTALLFLLVLSSILYRVGIFYYFITYLIIAIANAVIMCVIAYYCRLRKAMAATYGDDQEAYEVKNDPEDPNEEMKEWEYGMTLPPMPVENTYSPHKIYPKDP
ncbi:hypothetical protein TRFO_34810 [Tritrichomonas foetus]|uniref:Intimal thickness related receptor IRP domain-containing protein n=1 Tax=Tritrichomonas foetus TaxID=1144522 RepID=A0A1J4JNM0_9EUKA|nr:hypothetical protein TRFO_34810 [Tritrichomonas foetus]|eukprot:OHS98860.1 hypothetical protein TRFO_34810 [Tritrichomonas foetus]